MAKFQMSTPISEDIIRSLEELKRRYDISLSRFQLPLSLFPHLVDEALYKPGGELDCLTSALSLTSPQMKAMDIKKDNSGWDARWLENEERRSSEMTTLDWNEVHRELAKYQKLGVMLVPADGFLWADDVEAVTEATESGLDFDGGQKWICWLVSVGERRADVIEALRVRDQVVGSEIVLVN